MSSTYRGSAPDIPAEITRTLEQVLTLTGATIDYDKAAIHLIDADGGLFIAAARARHGHQIDARIRGLRTPVGQGFSGTVASTGEPFLSRDVRAEQRVQPAHMNVPGNSEILSYLGVPLRVAKEVIGVLELDSHTPDSFDENDLALAGILAQHASLAIENAQLLEASRRRQDELAQLYRSAARGRSRLDAIVKSMHDGVVAFETDGRAMLVNPRFYELHGLSSEIVNLVGLMPADLAAIIAPRLQAPDRGPSLQDQLAASGLQPTSEEVLLKHPHRVLRRVVSTVVDAQGVPIGRLALYHDVTADYDAQRLKDELLSVVSHELRTPLTSVLGYAKMLSTRPDAPRERREKWAAVILSKTRMLARLIEQILDLSRLNSGRLTFHFASADLGEMLRQAVEDMAVTAPAHRFALEILPGLPRVPVDHDRMQQVLSNLIGNAIKYSPEGGEVRVCAQRKGEALEVRVVDHGAGIPPEYAPYIFEPFYRVPGAQTRNIEGSGLGLAVSRSIVEAHGGTIWFNSEPGRGSTFYFTIPVTPSSATVGR